MNASAESSIRNPADTHSVAGAISAGDDLGLTPDAPWLGLRSFTESVRDYFYGRDDEIQALFDRVQHRTLTVLFGQSGLGKTSLLQAGLIPRLRDAGCTPILIRLVHDEAAESLQRQVVLAIAEAIPTIKLPQSTTPGLWELFHDPVHGLTSAGQVPVLIIDQFEELFTLGEAKRPEDARDFLEALACLVENRTPAAIRAAMEQDAEWTDRLRLGPQSCKVLLALRDDFLSRLERGRRQMPSMMDNRLELRLLSGQQAYRAVYEPGAKNPADSIVSRETARAIVRFVAGAPADRPLEEIDNVPPLMSLICEQLNARRLAQGEPTIRPESLAKSAPEVLENFYSDSFARHAPAVREFVEDQLVSPSGFREAKTLDAAKEVLADAGVADPESVLRQLVDQRLLVIEDRGGAARVELTHDILSPIAAAARKERAAAQRRLAAARKMRRWLMVAALLVAVVTVTGLVIKDQFEQQRKEIRAQELVQRLLKANPMHVPDTIDAMREYRKWIEPLLRTDKSLVNYPQRLNNSLARLDLLPAEDTRDDFLFLYDRLLDRDRQSGAVPIEFPVIRDALANRKDQLLDQLWAVAESTERGQESQRIRAASALATYDPESPRWRKVQTSVANDLVGASAIYLSLWVASLRPVRVALIPPLSEIFRSSRRELERSVASDILAEYAMDQPDVLTNLVLDADEYQFGVIYPRFEKYRERELNKLITVIDQAEIDPALPLEARDEAKETLAKRKANAAVILLQMNQTEKVWPLLKHSEDPRARSYLIHRLDSLGADPNRIIERLNDETDITIRRALLLCLGEFREDNLSSKRRQTLLLSLQEQYRTVADPGIHSALEWVLRRWQAVAWLNQVKDEWARDETNREHRLEDIRSTLGNEPGKALPRWYVNNQGQTMVVIPGPVVFLMGSPETEVAREDDEMLHEKRIGRTFTLAATPVTVEQYQKFDKNYQPPANMTRPEDSHDSPAVRIDWYHAALYCNWLSENEGIPENQWCYETKKDEAGETRVVSLRQGYLRLSGYRLPTEAESEYATRAGALTARCYGETDELLPKYAWIAGNSQRRLQPVGNLKPNDLGLFDVHGNANEWCQEVFKDYPNTTDGLPSEDQEDSVEIRPNEPRMFRGGSYKDDASLVRSAYRNTIAPSESYPYLGFRPARTLLPSEPAP